VGGGRICGGESESESESEWFGGTSVCVPVAVPVAVERQAREDSVA